MLRVLVVGLVVLVAAMFLLPRGDRGGTLQATTLLPQPRALPHVELTASTGMPLHLDEPNGEFTLLFFGYTNCPDVCPLTLKALADARQELARRARFIKPPRIVFVSVDPGRDTAAAIAAYLGHFDPEFVGATAADAALEPLLATFGVSVEKHGMAARPLPSCTAPPSTCSIPRRAGSRWRRARTTPRSWRPTI